MNVRTEASLSITIAILATIASVAGLLRPGLYRDPAYLMPQIFGQDLVTLVIGVPLLAGSTYFSVQGSLRGRLIWLGALFYFLYTYTSYAFMAAYNDLFLIYVALFSLSVFTISGALFSLDTTTIKSRFSARTPVKLISVYFIVSGILIAFMWLSDIIPALINRKQPQLLILSQTDTLPIQVLDLGLVVPLFIMTGLLLWKRRPWGYTLASILLVKGVTLGTAVLSMVYFMYLDGAAIVPAQVCFITASTLVAAGFAVVFFKNLETTGTRSPVTGLT